MALSFVYLAFVSLLRLLMRCGRTVDVKDVELLVLRHQVAVLRREVNRPDLRARTARCLPRSRRLLRPTPQTAARHPGDVVALAPGSIDGSGPIPARPGRPPIDAGTRELVRGWRARTRGGAISG